MNWNALKQALLEMIEVFKQTFLDSHQQVELKPIPVERRPERPLR